MISIKSDSLSVKKFWNDTAKRFNEDYGYKSVLLPSSEGLLNSYTDLLQRTALSKFLRYLSGKKVLDLGCGVGRWSSRLVSAGVYVVALDLSREMVKIGKKRAAQKKIFKSIDFLVASVQYLPFISETFDATLSVTVLQHVVDEEAFRTAVNEIVRMTKSEGQIILLEILNAKIDDFSFQFPTMSHDYMQAFQADEKVRLVEVRGVDLSLFLKPLNRVMRKHGRYRDQLKGQSLSIGYATLSKLFYFLASLACILSLPFDLAFRDIFLRHSEHKVYVFRR